MSELDEGMSRVDELKEELVELKSALQICNTLLDMASFANQELRDALEDMCHEAMLQDAFDDEAGNRTLNNSYAILSKYSGDKK